MIIFLLLAGCSGNVSPVESPTETADITPEASPTTASQYYTRVGNCIYLGRYPQTEVTDEELKAALTNSAGDTSTWTSYDYFIEGTASDFMVYKDVSFGGEKYRGVYFSKYRPWFITQSSVEEKSYQDDNGYYPDTVYWFKYDPIKWRILSKSNGSALLLADMLLDCPNFPEYPLDEQSDFFLNNYEMSHIRTWLNDSFLKTAFTDDEKGIIKKSFVDNSASTTFIVHGSGINQSRYICDDTYNRLFLLSYMEAIDSRLGFIGSSRDDPYREGVPTAYAMSQGARVDVNTAAGSWWLRSPGWYSYETYFVSGKGRIDNRSTSVNYTCICVRPALQLSLNG